MYVYIYIYMHTHAHDVYHSPPYGPPQSAARLLCTEELLILPSLLKGQCGNIFRLQVLIPRSRVRVKGLQQLVSLQFGLNVSVVARDGTVSDLYPNGSIIHKELP